MRARDLPAEVWVLLADWAGNPRMATVSRALREGLRGRLVATHTEWRVSDPHHFGSVCTGRRTSKT